MAQSDAQPSAQPDSGALDSGAFEVITDPGELNRAAHGPADRLVVTFANIVAWSFPLLMICIVAQIILRGTGHNQAWLDDLQWWIYGFAMMTGLGYAVTTGSHVRVDILYQYFSETKKAKIEAMAFGWMLLPFLVMMADILLHYAISSIGNLEGSDSPNGLHHLYILKTSLPLLFILAIVAAWASLRRSLAVFSRADLASYVAWTFPFLTFVAWRLIHYACYWWVYFTNPDIKVRRITREPIFDYVPMTALVLVVALLLIGYALRLRGKSGDGA